jgi:3-methyladenine DNA glycosylase/8-oxoguanine DNA glycosylase
MTPGSTAARPPAREPSPTSPPAGARGRAAAGPTDWARAAEAAAAAHPLAAELLQRHGPPTGIRRTPPNRRLGALAQAIAYQQLSGRAAATIWSRVVQRVGDPDDAGALAAVPHDDLRAAGLSNAKALAMADLAAKALDGTLDLAGTGRMPDADVVAHLTRVRGIGPWSAHMFLLFDLGRLDVWPTGDLGVRVGLARAAGLPTPPTEREMAPLGEPFAPWRSVLAWWCWREVDGPEGSP